MTALATTGFVATAVGPAVAQGSGGSKTLDMAFNADMQVPDPDIFYEVEGNEVVTSAYEGLVRYKPDSNEIEGALAESWDVSPDGLVYTFHLRPDVKFQTGGVADADAWIKSFERRIGVDSAPAYMLADVASTADARPEHIRRHAEAAGQPVPRLPGRAVRAQGGRPRGGGIEGEGR